MLVGLLTLALLSAMIAVGGWPGMRMRQVSAHRAPRAAERMVLASPTPSARARGSAPQPSR